MWLAIPQTADISPWRPSAGNVIAGNNKDAIDFNALQNAHLFGQYTENKPVIIDQPVVKDAPKTRLNLTLVGAVASNQVQTSLAVIANKGKQSTYGIGEEIEGTRATLKAVLVDRVIIENQGRDKRIEIFFIVISQIIDSCMSLSCGYCFSVSKNQEVLYDLDGVHTTSYLNRLN